MASLARLWGLCLLFVLNIGFPAEAASSFGPERSSTANVAVVSTKRDHALRELYEAPGRVPLWFGDELAAQRRASVLALLSRERDLDPGAGVDVAALADAFRVTDDRRLAEAELTLSRAVIGYLGRRRGVSSGADSAALLRVLPLLEDAQVAGALDAAVLELAVVEALGGWRPVGAQLKEVEGTELVSAADDSLPSEVRKMKLVADRAQLRRRLLQSSDLSVRHVEGRGSEADLVQAIRQFQRRHGLVPDGVVGSRTLATLNAPLREQVRRARLNLARNAEVVSRAGLPRYVEVNVPAFELRLVEDGIVVFRSRVIVGDADSPTPIFDDMIRFVDLNPSWYVPPSIVKEILDKNGADPSHLDRNGFYWRTTESGRAQLVQRPGPDNALGRFKFVFPNHHAVYLHDTAQRRLFGRSDQALSHGCVRVEKPLELALALLGQQGWTASRIEGVLDGRRTRRIELSDPVPVFLDYRTVEISPDGRLQLFADIYGLDQAAEAKVEARRRGDAARPGFVSAESGPKSRANFASRESVAD